MLNDMMSGLKAPEEKAVSEFYNTFKMAAPAAVIAAAYVLLKASQDETVSLDSLEKFLSTSGESDERADFLRQTLEGLWGRVIHFQGTMSTESLKTVVLYDECGSKFGIQETPAGISDLAFKLMEIKPGDKVADFCTGYGSTIRTFYNMEPNANYYGNDIQGEATVIAGIRAELLDGNITIKQEDIFEMGPSPKSFDTVFCNYPFGMRVRDRGDFEGEYAGQVFGKESIFKRPGTSMDWVFNALAYGAVRGPRRAVCIMTNGSTWNTLDRSAREFFVGGGTVEAVIALPGRLFDGVSIPTTMIVFSHGNTEVMMVDARELCEKGRRQNIITEKNAEEIYEACQKETKYSRKIPCSELTANGYNLYPDRYLNEEVTIPDGVEFSEIIRNITRGAQLKANQLDALVSKEPTDYQYLMLGNIQSGVIDDELPFLTMLDDKQEKYCIKNHSLIFSKNGAPFKIAVAEVRDGMKVLANGNLYVIELDEEKADPYYVKAFLESKMGQAELNQIVVGAVIPNIGVAQLKKILVPMPPLEKQVEVAQKYKAAIAEVKELQRRIEATQERMSHLFDESV